MMVSMLIDEVTKHPEIYNPDNKDFSNKEIRKNTFNTIGKRISGIPGEILQAKWDKMLNKYADFIRKLSNDDSSEEVLEQFMKWPWAKLMRNFKPYVRRQFQIPEFQPAIQLITEINIPNSATRPLHAKSVVGEPSDNDTTSSSEFPFSRSTEQGPAQQDDGNESPTNENKTPFTPKLEDSQFVHPVPEPYFDESSNDINEIVIPMCGFGFVSPDLMEGDDMLSTRSPTEDEIQEFGKTMAAGIVQDLNDFKKFIITTGQFPDTDDDDDNDDDSNDDDTTDDKIATSEAVVATRDDGPSSAKKRRQEDQSGSDKNVDKSDKVWTKVNGNTSHSGDNEYDGQTDVLPDLPQPKPVIKKGPLDFTAQEHTFLAWAKTMSTFTAKRQATVKMQINKIMSEAEFEDLDDEFFAAKKEPYRPIYTSRY